VTIVTGATSGQLVEDRVAEIEAWSTLCIPSITGGGAGATALTAVSDEELQVRLLPIDGDNDPLAAVLGWIGTQLSVVHGNNVVGVHLVKREQCFRAAHDSTLILILKGGTTGINLVDVVVISAKALATGDDRLGRRADCEEQTSCSSGLKHHDVERSKEVESVLTWLLNPRNNER
jgi:hypothetical protein